MAKSKQDKQSKAAGAGKRPAQELDSIGRKKRPKIFPHKKLVHMREEDLADLEKIMAVTGASNESEAIRRAINDFARQLVFAKK